LIWFVSENQQEFKMKKLYPLIGIAFVFLILIARYIVNLENRYSTDSSHSSDSIIQKDLSLNGLGTDGSNTLTKRNRPAATGKDSLEDVESLKSELKAAKAELEMLSRPLTENMLSSTVNAEISPGDTLVTGGYKTADGNYEMTFITPRSVTLSDGSEGIEIRSQVLSVGPEFVEKNGMETLATNAGNTLQHGESWKQDDVRATFTSAGQNSVANMMTTPGIITSSSSTFDIVIGEEGGPRFSIKGTVEKNSNGNFSIKSRVERTLGSESDAVPNP
jgi:hypothetical protein